MTYCIQCGTKLIDRYLESEQKEIPFCPHCNEYRFKQYNVAVSMIVQDANHEHILLIKQYHRDRYILVAGYVNPNEEVEHACLRELEEELSLHATDIHFNHSHFYAPSNTLMLNFTITVDTTNPNPNEEIDSYTWFTNEEALQNIAPNSLASDFLSGYLSGNYVFHSN